MAANGLELPTDDLVNLGDMDEVRSQKLDFLDNSVEAIYEHQDLLADLGNLAEPAGYPLATSPTFSVETLPSEPSSPIDLLPFLQPESEPAQPTAGELTDFLQSLLDGNTPDTGVPDLAAYDHELVASPVSDNSENSYSAYSPTDAHDSWNDDASSVYSSHGSEELAGKSVSKKKSKSTPYSQLPAGRKERKKKQNKEAAIRYREKKRKEALEAEGEESGLVKKNNELKTEVLNLEREIMCMKELLSDVFNIHSL